MGQEKLKKASFSLMVVLILISIISVLFVSILIYAAVYYSQARAGFEVYLAETFAQFPFGLIYSLLILFALFLVFSVVLLWFRKKLGLFLYFSWSFATILLLLFAQQIDWFTIGSLSVLSLVLALNISYFTDNQQADGVSPTLDSSK
jgi:phosphoglycerol transferase MdoB-like AlkP superfamily enzyme